MEGAFADTFAIVAVALTGFASTNLDNLLLLTLLLAQHQQSKPAVFFGYVASIVAVAVVGLVAARLADVLPTHMLGYLGVVPLAMGLHRLGQLLVRSPADPGIPGPPAALGVAGVVALTLANGADTLGVFLPLFAETPEPLTFVLAGTLIVTAMLWVALAGWVSGHPWVRLSLSRAERWLVPTLLIGVGLYILLNSPTDTLPGESFSLDADA